MKNFILLSILLVPFILFSQVAVDNIPQQTLIPYFFSNPIKVSLKDPGIVFSIKTKEIDSLLSLKSIFFVVEYDSKSNLAIKNAHQSVKYYLGDGFRKWQRQRVAGNDQSFQVKLYFKLPKRCQSITRIMIDSRVSFSDFSIKPMQYHYTQTQWSSGFYQDGIFKIRSHSPGGSWQIFFNFEKKEQYPGDLYWLLSSGENTNSVKYRQLVCAKKGSIGLIQKSFDFPVKQVSYRGKTKLKITWANYSASIDSNQAYLSDLYHVINFPKKEYRFGDFELFRWSVEPNFLIFLYQTYSIQSLFLKRLAFYVEKAGYSGKLLSDEELEQKEGWFAHDYQAKDLASFFQAAIDQSFTLNDHERLLCQLLEENGVIIKRQEKYQAGKGGLISAARDPSSVWYVDHLFLTHEALHALYFSEPGIARMAKRRWAHLSGLAKILWNYFLRYRGYDFHNLSLIENEYYAYSLTRPTKDMYYYFFTENWFIYQNYYPFLVNKLKPLKKGNGQFLMDESALFLKEVRKYYPIRAGDLRTLIVQ